MLLHRPVGRKEKIEICDIRNGNLEMLSVVISVTQSVLSQSVCTCSPFDPSSKCSSIVRVILVCQLG